uniref:Uncharacterized protein n=1 Tax=Oryza glumipatula TaxID=40148 RepID=A0A0D9YJ57_9ORYZ
MGNTLMGFVAVCFNPIGLRCTMGHSGSIGREHRRRGCGRRRWFGSFARLGSATAPEARVLRGGRRTRRRRQSTELPEQESSDGARSCGSSCFPSNLATPPGQIRGRPEAANGDPPAGYRQTR